MTSRRQARISELLHEELSILIGTELTDSRLEDAMLTVTDVVVSHDLRNARVFVEHALPAEASPQVLAALRHAEQFLRRALMLTLNLRYMPSLTFHIDRTIATGRRVDEILGLIAREGESEETRATNT